MGFDIHSEIGRATRVLVMQPNALYVFDRDNPGRGHVWNGLLCLTMEEAVRRMGYVPPWSGDLAPSVFVETTAPIPGVAPEPEPPRGWLARLRRMLWI